MQHNSTNTDRYGDGDIPEIDVEPYRDGSHVVTPAEPASKSARECHNGPYGE